MDWTTQNVGEDLRWYYLAAAGECGIRSTQAGFESQMAARALSGREDGTMHVKETRSSPNLAELPEDFDAFLARAAADMSRLAPITRARNIHGRLARLTEHQRRVLEAQFGCAHVLGDVSLALACLQSKAQEGHIEALAAARKLHEQAFARQKAKATGGAVPKHKPPTKTETKRSKALSGGSTVRDFVLFLCCAEETDALDEVLAQARAELADALAAYADAAKRAA